MKQEPVAYWPLLHVFIWLMVSGHLGWSWRPQAWTAGPFAEHRRQAAIAAANGFCSRNNPYTFVLRDHPSHKRSRKAAVELRSTKDEQGEAERPLARWGPNRDSCHVSRIHQAALQWQFLCHHIQCMHALSLW